MDGGVYKWNIAKNGQLMLGKSKYPGGKKLGWGHPTLVGGLKELNARIGGELRFGKPGKDDLESVFYINNDSGRYGEYIDRTPEMLTNVANLFKAFGFSVLCEPRKSSWSTKSTKSTKVFNGMPSGSSSPER